MFSAAQVLLEIYIMKLWIIFKITKIMDTSNIYLFHVKYHILCIFRLFIMIWNCFYKYKLNINQTKSFININ